MSDQFTLTYDATVNRVEFVLTGLWDAADCDAFEGAMRAAVARATPGFTILADLSGYPAQRQEVQDCHKALMAWTTSQGLSRAATIVPAAVAKLQFSRVRDEAGSHHDHIRMVASRTEAEEHLAA